MNTPWGYPLSWLGLPHYSSGSSLAPETHWQSANCLRLGELRRDCLQTKLFYPPKIVCMGIKTYKMHKPLVPHPCSQSQSVFSLQHFFLSSWCNLGSRRQNGSYLKLGESDHSCNSCAQGPSSFLRPKDLEWVFWYEIKPKISFFGCLIQRMTTHILGFILICKSDYQLIFGIVQFVTRFTHVQRHFRALSRKQAKKV